MIQSLKERIERMVEEGPKLNDIPYLALLIFAAIVVFGGELGCVLWFFVILVRALVHGAVVLLQLIPCAILFSVFTAVLLYVYWEMEENY